MLLFVLFEVSWASESLASKISSSRSSNWRSARLTFDFASRNFRMILGVFEDVGSIVVMGLSFSIEYGISLGSTGGGGISTIVCW